MSKLTVVYLPLSAISAYKQNPRKHTEKQIEQIVSSIAEFKFNNPIIIDENNEILAGHGRFLAATKLKLENVPTIKLDHLSSGQKKAYRIADNKLTENGQWDIDMLKLEFNDIENLNLDFELDITGFENIEIDNLINPTESDAKLNNIPEVKTIISKPGDIWQLGKHRIICTDALKQESFTALMGEEKADMVFTDPPYNVKIEGHVCGKGVNKHKEFAMASGELTENEFTRFLSQIFGLLKAFSKDGSLHFICMDWRHVGEMSTAGKIYDEFKNICVWNKNNAGMGSLYRSKHELIFLFKNGTTPHTNNVELGVHGRYRSNVWDYAGVNSFGKNRDLLKLHPTVKPVEMIWDAILDVSNRGAIVLDSFLGSGSALIACEKTKRICRGIELEPQYIDTAILRWQEITGEDAILIESGRTYNDLLAEKEAKNEK